MLSRTWRFTHGKALACPTLLAWRHAYRFATHTTSGHVRDYTATTTTLQSRSPEDSSTKDSNDENSSSAPPKTQKGSVRRRNISEFAQRLPDPEDANPAYRFREFELDDRVFVVTGGGRGLGLTLAEALVEAGAHVYCVDRLPGPADEFYETSKRVTQFGVGSLQYRKVDVQDAPGLNAAIADIAAERQRLDGLIAAAGIQYVSTALDYPPEKINEMMNINYTGVYLSAVACAREMIRYRCPGSMVLVGSMSGLIANKGLRSSVYNSSKAAVIQLGRSLAMEWGKILDGRAIRVNVLCPGNILTPMVEKNFEDEPHLKALWESENMMGRLSKPNEYRGAALFMLSDASSFMTGSHLVIDGGYTAW